MTNAPLDSTGMSRVSFGTYLTGFVLALILTAVSFALAMSGALSPPATLAAVFGAGLAQVLVHLYYFLHLNTSLPVRWNLAAMVFTVLIMILFVGGTIWIMWNLYERMM